MSSLTNADEFHDLVRAVSGSQIARTMARATAVFTRGLPCSWCGRRMAWFSRGIAGLGAAASARSIGILLLAAVVTYGMLLTLVPPLARPAVPRLLTLDVLLLSAVLIGAARSLERAWPSSWLRRMVSSR
jgi:hypothetical protein